MSHRLFQCIFVVHFEVRPDSISIVLALCIFYPFYINFRTNLFIEIKHLLVFLSRILLTLLRKAVN